MTVSATMHASAVAIGADGVLIRGPSGSGKSSLVLGLIDRDPETTRLVADDRVEARVDDGRLVARAPAPLAGRLEVRGQGIVAIDHIPEAPIRLVVDLLPVEACPRMPEPDEARVAIGGVVLPRLKLPIGATDGPARVRFALRHLPAGPAD
jgi:serine kinase of HPr protein (carbohydrate metabolism regulator)